MDWPKHRYGRPVVRNARVLDFGLRASQPIGLSRVEPNELFHLVSQGRVCWIIDLNDIDSDATVNLSQVRLSDRGRPIEEEEETTVRL